MEIRTRTTVRLALPATVVLGFAHHAQIATSVHWPVYTLNNPQNIVFDANVTDLLYAEPDYYRAEGIQYISDRFISVYGR
jgi:triacylglycerol lipase